MDKKEIIQIAKRAGLNCVEKPRYCRIKAWGEEHTKVCCWCGEYKEIVFQEGDGKGIHSLCRECYKINTHFCGGEEILEIICEECQTTQSHGKVTNE